MNFARLNHILIPKRADQRDALRRGLSGWLIRPFAWAHGAFTREGRSLLGIAIMVGVAGLDVGNSQVYMLWAALTGLLVGSIAARPFYGMGAAHLRVIAPRRATAGEPVTFDLEVETTRPLRGVRVDTPFLPWDGRWLGRASGIGAVDPGTIGRTHVKARFIERGEHHLDPFAARAMVPFGLAAGAPARSGSCRFLVLPRAARVVSLELAEGGSGDRQRMASNVLGPSGDLAGVRPYRPGDPLRHLHARTWARVGVPHVREHVRERNQRSGLVLLVDGRSDERVAEAAISLAAGVASVLAHQSGGLGLVALGEEVATTPPGGTPRMAVDEAMDRLAVHAVPARLDADAITTNVLASLADVSSLVVVTAERDEAPGEVPSEARAVIEALERTGAGLRVLLVVDDDAVPERGLPEARIGRGVIEAEGEIRI